MNTHGVAAHIFAQFSKSRSINKTRVDLLGADPNWGRVAMAIGKCSSEHDIDESRVVIRFGTQEVYPSFVDASGLAELSKYMRGDTVRIHVTLNTGAAECTVWGCDLTDGYVRINADYTT